jgi:phosphoribosylaminoimidazolecarboxamide formyltransferase/IMP cyclohydrolase
MKRALVSVHNKEGLVEFCKGLAGLGYEIVSTGGTHATLEKAGVPVVQVAQLTSFPEILGGRVKTLHPAIHGGILAKRTPEHLEELKKHNLSTIDVVVCNLYPFQETVRKEGVSEGEIVEQIDIGGVTLLRAAAKNFESVLVVCDPADYTSVLDKLQGGAEGVPNVDRKRFALKAFRHTATYDSAISQWLSGSLEEGKNDSLPGQMALTAEKVETLRYGENPHQQGALYRWTGADAPFEQVSGKELSYNNILDLDVAYTIAQEYSEPCVVIIKHNTPCGIATDPTNIITAYQKVSLPQFTSITNFTLNALSQLLFNT